MKYIQIKAIRKGTKPVRWRRIYLPLGVTFAQMACVLETALELPITDQYEIEFFHEKERIVEWARTEKEHIDFHFTYLDAVKTSVHDWLEGETWFNFRVRSSKEDFPQYRVEIEKLAGEVLVGIEKKPLMFPLILKESSCVGDPYWTDPETHNKKMQETCFWIEGEAEYPSFSAVIERIRQGRGILFCNNIESQDNIVKLSMQSMLQELADKIMMHQKEIEALKAKEVLNSKGAMNPKGDMYPKAVTMDKVLGAYTVNELIDIAEENGAGHLVQGKKTKAKMAYELARYFLEADVMRNRLLKLHEEELDAFESAILKKRFLPTEEEMERLEGVFDLFYLAEFSNNEAEVPEDAAAVYENICRNGYRDFHRKMRWLLDCLETFSLLYVVGDENLLYELYCRTDRFAVKREDFDAFLSQIPQSLNPCSKIGKKFAAKEALENGIYKSIEKRQRDVPYYIPTRKEIYEYSLYGYPAGDEAFRKLSVFLSRELKLGEADCRELCFEAFRIFSTGGMFSDFMDRLNKREVVFDSTNQARKLANIIMELNNNTRMFELRGHTPLEMRAFAKDVPNGFGKGVPGSGRTKILPMSSQAARLLEEGRSSISAMGFDVDLEETGTNIPVISLPNGIAGEVKTGTRKIYPNDPCPCGSGKKYKKCCGRR